MSELKIGNVTLENNLILAPMAGVTDLPFVCYAAGRVPAFMYGNGQRKSDLL